MMNIQVLDDHEITGINYCKSSDTSSTNTYCVKFESIYGSTSSLEEINIRMTTTSDIDIKKSNFNESSVALSNPFSCKEDGPTFKSNLKEVVRNLKTHSVDVKYLNFDESSEESDESLPTLICSKNLFESIFKSSFKEVIRKTQTTNIVIQNSNFDEPSDTLSDLIRHKKEKSIFKTNPKEINFRKIEIGNHHINDSNFNDSSGTKSTLCHKPDNSTLKSNYEEIMSISGFDASNDTDSVNSLKSHLSEIDLYPEVDSASICSLSDEECMKILFDDEWKAADDTSDSLIDDELEERLLSLDFPFEGKTNPNFRVMKNETLKRKMFCDCSNNVEDKSLLEDEDDEVLNRSKRLRLLNSCDDTTSTKLDEMYLEVNFQNIRTLFYKEDPLSKISELSNRNLRRGEREINHNSETSLVKVGDMLAEKINHTLNVEENSNGSKIFSWMTQNKDDLYMYRKHDLKYCKVPLNYNLEPLKKRIFLGEILCGTPLLPFVSSYDDYSRQKNYLSPKSSFGDSSSNELMQISLEEKSKECKNNTSDTEYCFNDIYMPLPDTFALSSVERRSFWKYLKCRTDYLGVIYEKIKYEMNLIYHIA